MPSLNDHHSSSFTKALLIGDSGTGKTSALLSLIKEGYKVRIIDLDNGLDALTQWVRRECPDKLKNVEYETLRDRFTASPMGPIVKGQPKAYSGVLKLLEKWTDDTDPAEWGADHILVIDSLTNLGESAFLWAKGMNPTSKDPRQWFYAAQRAIAHTMQLLTSEAFHCNVIVISHITYIDLQDGAIKGFPTAVGKELSKHLAKDFNNQLELQRSGAGLSAKRAIFPLPTNMVENKTAASFKMEKSYPIETGLADIFKLLREAS